MISGLMNTEGHHFVIPSLATSVIRKKQQQNICAHGILLDEPIGECKSVARPFGFAQVGLVCLLSHHTGTEFTMY